MENVFGEIKRVTAIVIVRTVQMSHRHAVSFENKLISQKFQIFFSKTSKNYENS